MKRLILIFLTAFGLALGVNTPINNISLTGIGVVQTGATLAPTGTGTIRATSALSPAATNLTLGTTSFGTGLTFTSATGAGVFAISATSPFFASTNADVADAGVLRLGNTDLVAWEANPAGTDITLGVNTSNQFVFSNSILSPALITPNLGTPSAINLTNANSLPSTALPSMSSATFLGKITDATGATGVLVGNQTPTIITPILSGVWTAAGSRIAAASAMGALAIDGNSAINTKSISADQTLTVANTPAADTYFGLWLTNTDTVAHTMTHTGGTPATFTAPVGTTFFQWRATSTSAWTMVGGPPSFNDFTTNTIVTGDFVPFWDISAGTNGKTTLANFMGAAPSASIPAASIASGALANGMTATTQSAGEASGAGVRLATDGYVDRAALTVPNAQTGTTYTLVAADGVASTAGVTMNNASPNTLTIPANASVAFAIGTMIPVTQLGAGATTIAITSDTLNSNGGLLTIPGQYCTVVLHKIGATTWNAYGTGPVVTYPITTAINTLLYASAANVESALATANSGVLITSASGVPSISSTLPSITVAGQAASTALTLTQTARTSGILPYIKYTIPTDTAQTAATESPGIQGVTGTRTWATTGTVALQREIFFPGPTYASASASQTFTDAFNMYLTPPVAGSNAIFTRGHTLGIVDATSAASSITGGLIVSAAVGTTATSTGIGNGNINTGGTLAVGGTSTLTGAVTQTAKTATYNNVATAGWGVPAIYAAGRSTAQTGAVASVSTYTCGAADGSFEVSANILVTASTTHAFTCTCAYTDEGNTARTITFNFSNVGGTLLTSIANTGGAVPYEGIPLHIRVKASTAITIATTGTFTSVTYNVEGIIRQLL